MPELPLNLKEASAAEFLKIHGIFGGPMVTIFVGPESTKRKYMLPKDLLCRQSPYFKAAFEGGFKEAQEGILHLPDDDPDTFDMAVQWIYLGHAVCSPMVNQDERNKAEILLTNQRTITQVLNFFLLADRLQLPKIEEEVDNVELVRDILSSDRNALTSSHIRAGVNLPNDHDLRSTFAGAVIKDYIQSGISNLPAFKFKAELYELNGFAVDLLQASAASMRGHRTNKGFDPLDYSTFTLRPKS